MNLFRYLEDIKDRITIEIPSVKEISPYVTSHTFKYLSISYNSTFDKENPFIISSKGKWLNSQEGMDYARELDEASLIIRNLNHLIKEIKS